MRRSAVVSTLARGFVRTEGFIGNPRLRIHIGPLDVCFLKLREVQANLGGCRLVTIAAGMRRMHGMPPITSRSMVTQVARMSIRLAGDGGRFSTSRLGLSSAKSKPEGDFGAAAARFRAVTLAWLRWLVSTMAESAPGAGGARSVGGFCDRPV